MSWPEARSSGYEIEGFVRDVTDEVEERESLVTMAETDPLTGVANRRAFDSTIEEVVRHARVIGHSVSLMVFDLDKFKEINDTYGHEAGDRVLRRVATVAQAVVRSSDILARIGGDELAIILPGTEEEAARAVAEKLQRRIQATSWVESDCPAFTVSVGICEQTGEELDIASLARCADTAMYRAKQNDGHFIAGAHYRSTRS